MPTITLTSDMGTADHYVAAVKGMILRQMDQVNLVDISHDITPFDTAGAAFILRHSWKNFGKGTVHIIGVNAETTLERPHRVVEAEGQYFVGTDNGIFALILDQKPDAVYDLNIQMDSDVMTFPMRDVLVKAACHLARGGAPSHHPCRSADDGGREMGRSDAVDRAAQEGRVSRVELEYT